MWTGIGERPYDRGMAKKKNASRADAVRDAVDQAFKTQIPRERLSRAARRDRQHRGPPARRRRRAAPGDRGRDQGAARRDRGAALRARRADARASSRSRPRPSRAPARRAAAATKRRRDEAGRRQARAGRARRAKPPPQSRPRRRGRASAAPPTRSCSQDQPRRSRMGAEFSGPKEFRAVMDRIFTLMSEDPDMGPKLRDADVPQRFEFEDVDMVVNIRAAEEGEEGCLYWQWNDDIDWKPKVKMAMSSETANKYFQGKENVADRDRPAPDQDERRREGRARAHPDHEARLRPVPRGRQGRVPAPRRSEREPLAARLTLSAVDSAAREAYESATRSNSGWLAIREAPPVRRRAPSTEAAGPIARRRRDHGPAVVLSAPAKALPRRPRTCGARPRRCCRRGRGRTRRSSPGGTAGRSAGRRRCRARRAASAAGVERVDGRAVVGAQRDVGDGRRVGLRRARSPE